MITLRPMRANEYADYCDYFVDDYGREISENYGHSKAAAEEMAKKDLERSFPNNLESADHDLLCIDKSINSEQTRVGYLWHSKNEKEGTTFIYDFYVSEQYRGLGIGKQAMNELEVQLTAQGISQVKLRVAYQNNRALKLYQSVGFVITGYNMSKNLVS